MSEAIALYLKHKLRFIKEFRLKLRSRMRLHKKHSKTPKPVKTFIGRIL